MNRRIMVCVSTAALFMLSLGVEARVEALNPPHCRDYLNAAAQQDNRVFWFQDWLMGWISGRAYGEKFDLARLNQRLIDDRLLQYCKAGPTLYFLDIAPKIYQEIRSGHFRSR